jgi:hypothetical protein
MKRTSATPTGAGGSLDQQRSARKNRQPGRKISSRNPASDLERGAPDIARPDEKEKYERQLAFIYAWWFEMLERIEGGDEEAATEARAELQTLFLNLGGQVLRVAQSKKRGGAKKWAGKLLADIYKSIEKHEKKLTKRNRDYVKESAKIGSKSLTSALFPRTLIAKIVKREWTKAKGYWKRLQLLSAIKNRKIPEAERQMLGLLKDWKEAAKKERIPKPFWPLLKFPTLSKKCAGRRGRLWKKILWPIIREKINLSKMPPFKVREYDRERFSLNPRARKWGEPLVTGKKQRNRYYSDVEKTAYDHFRLLVKLELARVYSS